MTGRAIVYLDSIEEHVDHDDLRPLAAGWEIHVRRTDGGLDVLTAAAHDPEGWVLRSQGDSEAWIISTCLGDIFMQALDPIGPM